jgi:hypothetical protein
MTLKYSTKLRNVLMTNVSDGGKPFAEVFKGGFADVYKGTRPTDADAIETASENFLFRILKDGGPDILAGPLTVGETYKITTFGAGDDFTNIGAANVVDNVFTATGTTPTTWTNGSIVKAVGLSFGNAVNGVISKPIGDTWKGIAVAAGLAAWFRFYASTQDIGDGTSGDKIRFEGRVATYGGQMNMVSTNIADGSSQSVDNFIATMPV